MHVCGSSIVSVDSLGNVLLQDFTSLAAAVVSSKWLAAGSFGKRTWCESLVTRGCAQN
jgi:hypothetical protein